MISSDAAFSLLFCCSTQLQKSRRKKFSALIPFLLPVMVMLQDSIEHRQKSHCRSMLQFVLYFTSVKKFFGTSVKEAVEEHLTSVKKRSEHLTPAGDAFAGSSGEGSRTYREALQLLSSQSALAGALSSCIKLECSLDQLSPHRLLHDKLCGLQK